MRHENKVAYEMYDDEFEFLHRKVDNIDRITCCIQTFFSFDTHIIGPIVFRPTPKDIKKGLTNREVMERLLSMEYKYSPNDYTVLEIYKSFQYEKDGKWY